MIYGDFRFETNDETYYKSSRIEITYQDRVGFNIQTGLLVYASDGIGKPNCSAKFCWNDENCPNLLRTCPMKCTDEMFCVFFVFDPYIEG